MRINYLRIKNFANILSATGKHDIEIDFPDNGKKVFLIVGENGSGKSSIMDQLHPFIENSTTRSFRDLLIPSGKGDDTLEAYKEIHIVKDHDIYVIKHFIDHRSRVKSFIALNNKELNPNGNVGSFKEVVEEELYVTLDFMKLLSLGTNSRTFIKMSATERKKFISDIMQEVDFYNQAFKIVSEKARFSKRLMNNVASDMQKNEVSGGEHRLSELESELNERERTRDKYLAMYSEYRTLFTQNAPKGVDYLENYVMDLTNRLNELGKELSLPEKPKEKIVEELTKQKERLHKIDKEIIMKESSRDTMLNTVDDNNKEIKRLEGDIRRVSSNREEGALKKTIQTIKEMVERYEEEYGVDAITYTSSDLMDSLQLAKRIDELVDNVYGFNNDRRREVCEHWLRGQHIEIEQSYIQELRQLERERLQVEAMQSDVIRAQEKLAGQPTPILFHNGNIHDCPFEKFYLDVIGEKVDEKTKTDKLMSISREIEDVEEGLAVNSTLSGIAMLLSANSLLIQQVPHQYLDMKNIISAILAKDTFYNEEIITSQINRVDKYNEYLTNKDKLKELGEELKTLTKEKDYIRMLLQPKAEREKENEVLGEKITGINDALSDLYKTKEKLTKITEKLASDIRIIEHHQNVIDEKEQVAKKLEKFSDHLEKARTNEKAMKNSHDALNRENYLIEQLRYNLSQVRRKVENYKILNEKKKELLEEFEASQLVRRALSSTDGDGIPLVYIQIYMAQTLSDINNILDIVYDGKMTVPRFDIGDREFNIPYINNGVEISDVNQCSQGEEAFMSIAISFAFVSRSMEAVDSFNIPRFDEVDGPLDTYKRERFLDIINLQIDKIDAEQIFIISHNRAFDGYPVNVVELTKGIIDDYTNKTVIEIKEVSKK